MDNPAGVPEVLAFGVATSPHFVGTRVVASTPVGVVDVGALAASGLLTDGWWRGGVLHDFLAAGRTAWQQVMGELDVIDIEPGDQPHLGSTELHMQLPVVIGDYVDFYASRQHATNLGALLRPGQEPLTPNWTSMPIGYHGRSGTIVVSGTPVRRPNGQRRPNTNSPPEFGASQRLDVEVEVGYVVGVPSRHGTPVPVGDFAQHVFGVCLVNDWSARDIQAWEGQPLGPFLGKSFATSISPWLVPLDVLASARVPVESAGSQLLPYLEESEPAGLGLTLSLAINGEVLSRPPYSSMFWSPAQMLAHMTVNGASIRTGDLFASGTVSGPAPEQWGSLIELFDNERFLSDGDEIVISATVDLGEAPKSLGEVRGIVLPQTGARE